MPIRYTINGERGVMFTTADGLVREEDLRANRERYSKDPSFRPSLDQLIDFSAIETFEVSTDFLVKFAISSPFGEGARRAVVVTRADIYGAMRASATFLDDRPGEFRIFDDIEAARRWLGLALTQHLAGT